MAHSLDPRHPGRMPTASHADYAAILPQRGLGPQIAKLPSGIEYTLVGRIENHGTHVRDVEMFSLSDSEHEVRRGVLHNNSDSTFWSELFWYSGTNIAGQLARIRAVEITMHRRIEMRLYDLRLHGHEGDIPLFRGKVLRVVPPTVPYAALAKKMLEDYRKRRDVPHDGEYQFIGELLPARFPLR